VFGKFVVSETLMHLSIELLYKSLDQTLISCWLYGKMGVGMWMMCLGGLGGRWGLGGLVWIEAD
jgi:hypothetical protein